MADQNRKTEQQRAAREQAQRTVDRFLEVLAADEHGIAWEGRSLLGIYSEHGEIPRSSGFSGFCKLGGKVDRMRDWTPKHREACRVMLSMSEKQAAALCVDRYYRGSTKMAIDPFVPERSIELHWDDRRCADFLQCEVKVFQRRVSDGYARLESLLGQHEKQAA